MTIVEVRVRIDLTNELLAETAAAIDYLSDASARRQEPGVEFPLAAAQLLELLRQVHQLPQQRDTIAGKPVKNLIGPKGLAAVGTLDVINAVAGFARTADGDLLRPYVSYGGGSEVDWNSHQPLLGLHGRPMLIDDAGNTWEAEYYKQAVRVRQVVEELSDGDDQVEMPAGSGGLGSEELYDDHPPGTEDPEAILDWFHSTVPIGALEDFEIDVVAIDDEGQVVPQND